MCYLVNHDTIHGLALIVRTVYLLSAVNTAGELHITFITVCVCVWRGYVCVCVCVCVERVCVERVCVCVCVWRGCVWRGYVWKVWSV